MPQTTEAPPKLGPFKPHKGEKCRPIERDFLLALANSVTLEDWGEIVGTAVQRAKEGDHRAREWLSGWILPNNEKAMSLMRLAKQEASGVTSEKLVDTWEPTPLDA